MLRWLNAIDRAATAWMNRHGTRLLRWAVALVYIWFGLLKPLGWSPANPLVIRTLGWLIEPDAAVVVVGGLEVAIGLCLLIRPLLRLALVLLALQLVGAFSPLVLLPGDTWNWPPLVPTLEGQYIIKDLVLLAAAVVLGGTARTPQEATPKQL